MVSENEQIEIAQGKHYHAWHLDYALDYLGGRGDCPGRAISHLAYTAARQPHRDRSTARRHAKQMAEPEYGSAGYMALVCDGGAACPYFYDTFKPVFNRITLKWDGLDHAE